MKRVAKWLLISLCVLPVGLCAGFNLAQYPAKGERDRDNQARGDQIVAAIWEFHADNAGFPKNLRDLEPEYVPDVPSLRQDLRGLTYRVADAGFSLEFLEASFGMISGDGYYRYSSQSKSWEFYLP